MAWGMFLAIPCPRKIWSESARQKMLVCMPLVGLLAGGVWAGAWLLLRGAPGPVRAAVCAAAPWLVTGFMHLDGYMDVCDAVLSRRDLATRQRILKDSHCGAFAVICMVLLAMGQWSLFLAAEDVSWLALLLIPAATRACAGLRCGCCWPCPWGFPCGWTGASALWRRRRGTAWRCGTASGIWTACPGISPALP